MKRSQKIGLILAIIILATMNFIPTNHMLTIGGRNSLGVLFAILILLITEPIPIGITCIFGVGLLTVFKAVPNISVALNGYTNPIVFFVLVSFGISAAITKVPLSKRLLAKIVSTFGKSVSMVLLSIMVSAAIISSIVSNVATTAVFITVILQFLNIYTDESQKKQTGKSFMIGLPVASMIGGMLTPAGSSLNLMCIDLLHSLTGIRITFVQWMLCGIPIVAIVLPLAWFIIIKTHPPVELSSEDIQKYVETLDVPPQFSFNEIYVLSLMSIMFVLWVLSSWIPAFNITLVTIFGFTLLFLPKISILTWEEFLDSISWPAFFLVSTTVSIGNALVANGVSDWIAEALFPNAINLPIFALVFIVSIAIFIMLLLIPVAPALIPMLIAPLIALAGVANINPIFMVMTLGLCVANCYLLPLDTVPLLTYMTGYYKIGEMAKSTGLIQLSIATVVAIWLPVALSMLGIS